MVLRNLTTSEIIASEVDLARTAWQRSIGLLRRKIVEPHQGMWFPNSWSVHTIGMRAHLDVLFLDHRRRIVSIRSDVAPNSFAIAHFGAANVVELGAGALHATDLLIGDILVLEP